MCEKIWILDTTLRDGMQGEGISYTVGDKLEICKTLDEIGIPIIEAGNPYAVPKDRELFSEISNLKLKNAKISAFGSTRKKNVKASEDAGLLALCSVDSEFVSIVGKASRMHVTEVLKTTLEENIDMIFSSVELLVSAGRRVIFDAEHFFEGFFDDSDYALRALDAAVSGGAEFITLCDTNGGMQPRGIYKATVETVARFGDVVGIHAHDDMGLAAANSIEAVNAGAVMVQGTFTGFGERCGNAALTTVIPNLQLALGKSCIPKSAMKDLTGAANRIAELSNMSIPARAPFVGRSAFAHKAGMHMDAMKKIETSFETITPQSVGNTRRFLLSEMSGRSALADVIKRAVGGEAESSMIDAALRKLKELELSGYQFEAAEASFELVVKKVLGKYKPAFELCGFKTIGEQADGSIREASAMVHISVDGKSEITAALGNGPVDALNSALRKALEVFYPKLKDIYLTDYKVRVLDNNTATKARVRVLITSTDGKRTWSTVGVSQDIIQASWLALVDSIEYTLI